MRRSGPDQGAAKSHGAPLAYGSCAPPAQASGFLTLGSPDANGASASMDGSVLYNVKVSAPADVLITISTTDVRCQVAETACGSPNDADGPDYTGELLTNASLRITDQANGSATVQDIGFPVDVPCSATPSGFATGGVCAISTSANAVVPGSVHTGKRAIWQLGQVQVYDGGASGVAGSSDATLFLDEGVFVDV